MTFKCIFQVLINPRLLHYLLNMPTSLPHRHWSWFCNYHISLPPVLPSPKPHTHANYRYFFYFQAFTLGKCQSNLPRCLNQRSGIILDSSFFIILNSFHIQPIRKPYWLYFPHTQIQSTSLSISSTLVRATIVSHKSTVTTFLLLCLPVQISISR